MYCDNQATIDHFNRRTFTAKLADNVCADMANALNRYGTAFQFVRSGVCQQRCTNATGGGFAKSTG